MQCTRIDPMRSTTAFVLLIASLALGACGTRLQTRVEAFASPAAPRGGETVHVIPAAAVQHVTLEHQEWVRLAEREFAARGLRVVEAPASASLVAVIGLAMDAGRDVARPFLIPQWGVTGYSGAQTFGTFSRSGNFGTYSGTTTLMPQYGITGYTTGVTSQRVFTSRAILLVFRPPYGPNPVPVFEARAVSEGSCGMLSAVAPSFVAALFEKCPSGGTGVVVKEIKGEC
jgi:hypothetical protein